MSERVSAAAMVHLENELGPELARVLFDPNNVGKVRELVQKLTEDGPPAKTTGLDGEAFFRDIDPATIAAWRGCKCTRLRRLS